jgi:intracellular sulfur oxidation DsrE/DsrF family protein
VDLKPTRWHTGGRAILLLLVTLMTASPVWAGTVVATPYSAQKAVFDFYFNDPSAINSALYWIGALMNPLNEEPYNFSPERHEIKVVIHGMELVTLAKKNTEKYRDAVERMKYLASLGVEFKACALAIPDYGYRPEDLHDFVEVVPSAIAELAHWQNRGFALIPANVMHKIYSIEQIR